MKQIIRVILVYIFFIIFGTSGIASDIIQTQESNQNEEIVAELKSIKVKSSIVTVRVKIRNKSTANEKINFYFKDLYLLDEENQKKYFILKDSEKNCIGGPFSTDAYGGRFEFWIDGGKIKNIWAKLPMPVNNPKTISISVPGFLPFEDVELPQN